jgi:glutathione S-transferase
MVRTLRFDFGGPIYFERRNGLMEVAVLRRVESLRAKEADRDKNMARQATIASRVLDRLEADAASLDGSADLGNLSIAIALDYLYFRFAADAWRERRPKLAAWHERYSKRESLKATMPK